VPRAVIALRRALAPPAPGILAAPGILGPGLPAPAVPLAAPATREAPTIRVVPGVP